MVIALGALSVPRLMLYRRVALAATIACAPFYVVRFRVGPLPSTLLEAMILVTLVVHAGVLIRTRAWRVPRTPIEVPTALFALAAALGIAVATDHWLALGEFRAFFVEPVLIFYVALDTLQTPRDFRLIAGAVIAGGTVFAILNLGVWADTLARHRPIISTDAPTALNGNPNGAAMFLEPALAFAIGFAFYAGTARERIAAGAAATLLLAATVSTLSRAGLLTLAALALLAVVTVPGPRVRVAVVACAAVVAFAALQLPWIASRLAHQLDLGYSENTFEGRLQIWKATLRMLRDHPILGAGIRSYQQVVARYMDPGQPPQLHAHNVWLAMWSDLGMLGLLAFAALVAILLWRGWRGFLAAGGISRAVLWGASASLVAIVVHGTFDTPYFKNDLSLEFWIVAALEVAALAAIQRAAATRQPAQQR